MKRVINGLLLAIGVLFGMQGITGCTVEGSVGGDGAGASGPRPVDHGLGEAGSHHEEAQGGKPGANPDDPDEDPESDEEPTGASAGSWTYLVYMLADNDLEPFALDDLEELMAVGSNGKLTILAEVDRAVGEVSGSIGGLPDFTTTKRLRVDRGSLKELDDLGELDLGTPEALQSFLEWGMKAAPAEHYALVLWDHGASWPQFGADFSHQYNGLTLQELTSALDRARKSVGRSKPLDLVGFDACLMGTWEIAAALEGRARFLLGSEELEPGHGWDHRAVALLEHGAEVEELGRELLAGYQAQARAQGTLPKVTLSLTEIAQVGRVSDALGKLASALSEGGVESHAARVGRARAESPTFGQSPSGDSSEMTDIARFAARLAALDESVADEVKALEKALDDAVVAQVRGAVYSDVGGLAFYFPERASAYDSAYDALSGVAVWRDYLKQFYGAASELTSNSNGPEFSNPNKIIYAEETGDGLLLSGDLVQGSYDNLSEALFDFGVVVSDESGMDVVVLLGEQPAQVSDAGRVSTEWDRTALSLKEGNNQALAYYVLASESEELLSLTIPFVVTEGLTSQMVFLVIVFDLDGNVATQTFYEVVGGAFAEHVVDESAVLQTSVPVIDPNDGSVRWETQSAEFSAEADLEFTALDSGAVPFYLSLSAYDYAGQSDTVDGIYR